MSLVLSLGSIYKKVLRLFEDLDFRHFWGNYFDSRFYIAYIISNKHTENLIDVGCGGGILLSLSPAKRKIGVDLTYDSLKDAKRLDSQCQVIQADATHLPFRDQVFDSVIAVQILPELKKNGLNWQLGANEIQRVSSQESDIIIAGNNRRSRHWNKTKKQGRFSYLTYDEQISYLKSGLDLSIEGYDPHPKVVMYCIKKLILNLPERIISSLSLERILFWFLKSRRYIKNGRSYIIKCKKKQT